MSYLIKRERMFYGPSYKVDYYSPLGEHEGGYEFVPRSFAHKFTKKAAEGIKFLLEGDTKVLGHNEAGRWYTIVRA